MTNTQHTPGPWCIEHTATTLWLGVVRPNSHKVDDIVCSFDIEGYTDEYIERQYANARLIAAAPDLLSALGFAVLWHRMEVSNGRNGMPKQLLDSVETAIINAIGAK